MLCLAPAKYDDLTFVATLEQVPEVDKYIVANTLGEHKKNMRDSKFNYLMIMQDQRAIGFVLLGLDDDGESIELRRLAIADRCHGIGQEALILIEKHCASNLDRIRIWLDVFSENTIARHIYEKHGYQPYDTYKIGDKYLILYEKSLSNYSNE